MEANRFKSCNAIRLNLRNWFRKTHKIRFSSEINKVHLWWDRRLNLRARVTFVYIAKLLRFAQSPINKCDLSMRQNWPILENSTLFLTPRDQHFQKCRPWILHCQERVSRGVACFWQISKTLHLTLFKNPQNRCRFSSGVIFLRTWSRSGLDGTFCVTTRPV